MWINSFQKYGLNPILAPQGDSWEGRAVFNPAAWTNEKEVYLLYRAEEIHQDKRIVSMSRIGLAISDDGFQFTRVPYPVMEPTETYENFGGCEDPRIVRIENKFYMTYTAYDGKIARLALAISEDLRSWQKIGPVISIEQWEKLNLG